MTSPSVTETTTVLILSIIISVFGIGFFCWLLFTLAVYALPFFVAMTAGFAALHSGAGVIGAIVVGIVVGIVTLAAGQLSFAIVRLPVIRAAIALLFAVPAAVAGYHGTLGLITSPRLPIGGPRPSRSSEPYVSAPRPGHA